MIDRFILGHHQLTRRRFMRTGAGAAAAVSVGGTVAAGTAVTGSPITHDDVATDDDSIDPKLREAIGKLEPFFTKPDDFRDVSRGKPLPHSLPEEKKSEVGLTRESWRLEVISDPDRPAKLGTELTRQAGNALTFEGLLKLAETRAVRIPKVMTCLNIGCPLGMGIWEGVPMRDVLWMTQPREDLRRVFYYGYHNDDPKQMFRSSLPPSRIFEDPYHLPPVILCYKLNGQWLSSERGGPVRVVVPEHYGFKSVKWLSTIVLSNLEHANDTYANGNNDLDSPIKSFAATLNAPKEVKPDTPFAITGYAQVGISGVSKVQVAIHNDNDPPAPDDKFFAKLAWIDAEILGPPNDWGGDLPDGKIPDGTIGFERGKPKAWPIPLGKIHWAILVSGLPPGEYTLRTRTIDDNGHAQPMPRPFQKSGHAAIEMKRFTVS